MIVYKNSSGGGFFSALLGFLFLVAFLVGLFYMASLVFKLLYFLGPLILIAVLIIDRTVLFEYLRWLRTLFKQRILQGILVSVLSVLGYPMLSTFLLLRAVMRKKVRSIQEDFARKAAGDLADFEELETRKPSTTPQRTQLPNKQDDDYIDFV